MADAKVRIAYDGSDLQNGAMDVNDLAPALIEFGKLVQRINVVVGNKQPVRVMLKANDIRKGSFDISFELVTSFLEEAKLFVGLAEDVGIDAIFRILGYGGATYVGVKGIFDFIKKIKNAKPVNLQKEGNSITLVFTGDVQYTITEELYNVYKDVEVRRHIEKVVEPLKKEGIDSFELRNPEDLEDKEPEVKIDKEDVENFKAPTLEEIERQENHYTQSMILQIVAVVFDENQKWRFTDGDSTFWAKIDDAEFWSKIESRELVFGKGDRLKVECTVCQIVDGNGNLTITRTIGRVLEVVPKPTQIKLF